MVQVIRNFEQTLLRGYYGPLTVIEMDVCDLIDPSYRRPLDLDDYLGVACCQDAKGVVTHLAFATTSSSILCIRLTAPCPKAKSRNQVTVDSQRRAQALRILLQVFLQTEQTKFAFDMHKLALALFYDYGLTVVQAVDLQSSRPDDRRSVATLVALLGGEVLVNKGAVIDTFRGESFVTGGIENLAVRAWAARRAALDLTTTEMQGILPIDTSEIPDEVDFISRIVHFLDLTDAMQHLAWLAKFTRTSWRLHEMKPAWTKNDVAARFKCESGNATLQVQQTRFKTRLRTSHNQVLISPYPDSRHVRSDPPRRP